MKPHGATLAKIEERDKMIAGVEDLLEVGADVHLLYETTGRDYLSLRRSLVGAGRHDLVVRLQEMQKTATDRLNYALGRQWQA